MFRNILLPLDGSTFSEHALPLGIDLAVRSGARLHLVQVHEPPVAQVTPTACLSSTSGGTAPCARSRRSTSARWRSGAWNGAASAR
jgi:nucleotide-binding universal stress UspA family protein